MLLTVLTKVRTNISLDNRARVVQVHGKDDFYYLPKREKCKIVTNHDLYLCPYRSHLVIPPAVILQNSSNISPKFLIVRDELDF